MRNGIRTTLGMLTTALTALVFVVTPAAAAGNTQISGVGTFETANPPTSSLSEIGNFPTGRIVVHWRS